MAELVSILISLFMTAFLLAMGVGFAAVMIWLIMSLVRFNRRQLEKRKKRWREWLAQLDFKQTDDFEGHGRIDGLPVRVWQETRKSGDNTVTYSCVDVQGLPKGLQLKRETFKFFGGRDIEIGDKSFDDRVEVYGNRLKATAVMDHATRTALKKMRMGTTVKDGLLHNEVSRTSASDAQNMVEWAMYIANALRDRGDDIGESLGRIVDDDPVAEVRERALYQLLHHMPNEEGLEAARGALSDPDPRVRLLAAGRLRDADALREAVYSKQLSLSKREYALRTLGSIDGAIQEDELVQLLSADGIAVRNAAIELLGHYGTVRAVEPLLPLSKGGLLGTPESAAAKKAIAAIQSRVSGAEAGGLSLTELAEGVGGLSVAEPDERGGLSMARPPKVAQ